MRLFEVILLILLASYLNKAQDVPREDDIIICEPKNLNRYVKFYNVTTQPWLSGRGVLYRSIHDFVNHSYTDDQGKFHHVQSFALRVMTFQVGDFRLFRMYDTERLFTFYHGDTFTIFQLDPKSAELTITRLGFHTMKFFHAVPKGTWLTTTVEEHSPDDFAVVGVNIFPDPRDTLNYPRPTLGYADKLLMNFPEHRDVIIKYSRKTL